MIGNSSSFFKLKPAKKEETTLKFVKKMIVQCDLSEGDPYASESGDSDGGYFIEDSLSSDEEVPDEKIISEGVNMLGWVWRQIIIGKKKCNKEFPDAHEAKSNKTKNEVTKDSNFKYDNDAENDQGSVNPKPILKRKNSKKTNENQTATEIIDKKANKIPKQVNIQATVFEEDKV